MGTLPSQSDQRLLQPADIRANIPPLPREMPTLWIGSSFLETPLHCAEGSRYRRRAERGGGADECGGKQGVKKKLREMQTQLFLVGFPTRHAQT